jgi:hypothetical protein
MYQNTMSMKIKGLGLFFGVRNPLPHRKGWVEEKFCLLMVSPALLEVNSQIVLSRPFI